MRLLAVCLGVTFLFTVFTVVTVIKTVRGNDPDPWVPHPPETVDERAAAKLAFDYAAAMQRRDFAAACRLTADRLAAELHCSTRPRQGGWCDGAVIHAKEDGDVVKVRLEMCSLRIARRNGQRRVVEYVPLVGYA